MTPEEGPSEKLSPLIHQNSLLLNRSFPISFSVSSVPSVVKSDPLSPGNDAWRFLFANLVGVRRPGTTSRQRS
jgi:hypothetical protein